MEYLVNILIMHERHFHFHSVVVGILLTRYSISLRSKLSLQRYFQSHTDLISMYLAYFHSYAHPNTSKLPKYWIIIEFWESVFQTTHVQLIVCFIAQAISSNFFKHGKSRVHAEVFEICWSIWIMEDHLPLLKEVLHIVNISF